MPISIIIHYMFVFENVLNCYYAENESALNFADKVCIISE